MELFNYKTQGVQQSIKYKCCWYISIWLLQLFKRRDSVDILTDDDWVWLASMTRDWWPSKSDTADMNGDHDCADDDECDDDD